MRMENRQRTDQRKISQKRAPYAAYTFLKPETILIETCFLISAWRSILSSYICGVMKSFLAHIFTNLSPLDQLIDSLSHITIV